MKKIYFISIILMIMMPLVRGQESEKLHFGIKAGANYSNVYDVKGENFTADYKFGMAGGVFISIPLGQYIGIHPEALYSQKGYESKGSLLGSSYKITHTEDFIDIPILLEVKPADFLTVLAGPQYSFLVRTRNDFNNSLLTVQQQQDYDKLNIRKNTLCFLGGLDFNISHLVIGGRLGWDLLHNNGDGTSTSPRYRNMWYQATLGVRF